MQCHIKQSSHINMDQYVHLRLHAGVSNRVTYTIREACHPSVSEQQPKWIRGRQKYAAKGGFCSEV